MGHFVVLGWLVPESSVKATKKIVMVVDDEVGIRDLLQRHLSKMGFEVLTAPTGEQALTFAAQVKPDLILLDVEMPGMGGIQCLRKMQELKGHWKVLMLTGVNNEQVAQLAMRSGAADYLTKPVALPTLQKAVSLHLLMD